MANAETWAARVEAWKQSGTTAPEFCAERDFAPATLLWWSSRLRTNPRKASPKSPTPNVRLAHLIVRPPVAPPEASELLVVELGGARVLIPPGVDRATLSTVFEMLDARRIGVGR